MKIEVTQEDIDKGVCSSYVGCAIANAASRVFSKPVRVSEEGIIMTLRGKRVRYAPIYAAQEVIDFIMKFDTKEPVSPCTFEYQLVVEETYED